MSGEIMRFRYRIGNDKSKEVIATKKICEKRRKELLEQHGDNVKISKTVRASTHPNGAPHV